ncbi:MAG: molybdopterin cofactor-binding domain-containing protein [Pseudomonadota bacterium]
MEKYSIIGKRQVRTDSAIKATGSAKFAGDFILPGMLIGKILRSPLPHAKILNIDTSKALKLKGVRAVVTGKDITDVPHGIMRVEPLPEIIRDKFSLAKQKVRFIGDEVAAVAAVDEDTAMEALELIKVDYEELPALFDIYEAMKPDAIQIHEYFPGNISTMTAFHHGDVDKAFAESDFILEDKYETQQTYHSYIEPHAVTAEYYASGDVTIWPSTQTPFYDKVCIAETIGIPVNKVRIIKPHVGGGFGGKGDVHSLFPVSALLSKITGKPVTISYTREEDISTCTRRHAAMIEQKIGVKKDGRIMGFDSKILCDGGAYQGVSMISIFAMAVFQHGPYRLNNFKCDARRIYTNKPYCGAQRGHGGIQPRFVIETMMDIIAEKLNVDPIEIRKINALKAGDTTVNKFKIRSCGHVESLDTASKGIGWKENWKKLPRGRGVGLASNFFASGPGFSYFFTNPPSHSGVNMTAEEDGSFLLYSGSTDLGQGSETALAMIAAEEIGLASIDPIKVIAADTATTPMDLGTYGSRLIVCAGNAAKMAANKIKEELIETAAEALEANKEDLEARDGRIYIKGNPEKGLTIKQAVQTRLKVKRIPLSTVGYYNPPVDTGDVSGFAEGKVSLACTWSFGCHAAEVEVDEETGVVKVPKIAAAHDCGFAINRMAVEGQIEGCVSMTFGQATCEDYRTEKGWSMTNSFLDYKIPTAEDMPDVQSIIVESMDTEGPFGAKEASEGANIPTIPAIANAIYYATGARIKELPITPERILRALEKKGGKE